MIVSFKISCKVTRIQKKETTKMLPFTKLRHISLLTTQLVPPTPPLQKKNKDFPANKGFIVVLGELSAGLLSWLRLLAGGGLYPAYAVEHLLLKMRFSMESWRWYFWGGFLRQRNAPKNANKTSKREST